MKEWVGKLATSKAGHDKNQIFYIIEESDEYVFLADGKYRTLEKPKKKKKKHLQIIKEQQKQAVTNEEIKRILKLYSQRDY